MKKVFLSVIGFSILCRMNVMAQSSQDGSASKAPFTLSAPAAGSGNSGYQAKPLKLEEVNLISSYYLQDGDHSAVTGGIGSQHVIDFSNGIDLKFTWSGKNKNSLNVGMGLDHHSSASSAYVALHGGASREGTRIYPSVDWTVENETSGTSFGAGAYYSSEYNYKSKGLDLHFSQKTSDKNGEFGVKLQGYFDDVTLIYPSEFVPAPVITVIPAGTKVITTASGNRVVVSTSGQVISNSKNSLATTPRTTLSSSFSYSQIINSRLQVMLLADLVTQSGDLGLPFHRVYFKTGKDTIEKLPSSRFKLPVGLRLNYFLGDNVILRSYYRYYSDNWGTNSHTANLEIAYKATPFLSISPFYRYYTQTAAKYFAPYEAHSLSDVYYTSNYEYAAFQSSFFGVGARIVPSKGVFGWQSFHDMEIRYGHYSQTTGLVSDVVSVSIGFK